MLASRLIAAPAVPASWPALGVVLGALVLATGVAAGLGRLGVARQAVTAALRATVQLGVVSLVIVAVLRSAGWTAAFVAMMYVVASVTAGQRMAGPRGGERAAARGGRPFAARTVAAGAAIAAGVAPVLGLLLGSGVVATRPVAVLPIAGILIGGAMTATGLGGRRALDDLHRRRGEYEARLALGFAGPVARRDVVRPAAAQALLPALDQTRTVGLVTLPGAFVGVLLGGAGPVQAGMTQLLVLIGLLAIETVAVLVVVELVAAGLIGGPAEQAPATDPPARGGRGAGDSGPSGRARRTLVHSRHAGGRSRAGRAEGDGDAETGARARRRTGSGPPGGR